ncbi:hypothetical protein [Pseudomonas sp. LRF_L74]|uniref:hypothetical protein n=1 Tax=Pseudomonas sp. LRF_L74 TaxID=3369422 RepID=UPI003F61DD93
MSENKKAQNARGLSPSPLVIQDTQPARWAPGVEVDSKEDYDRFTHQLALELLDECTPVHIAVVAAQHMMFSDLLSRALDESRRALDVSHRLNRAKAAVSDAKLESYRERLNDLRNNWNDYTDIAIDFYKKKTWGAVGKKRHAETTKMKGIALAQWNEHGANVSSMSAFARARHKEFGVTERTLYEWIRKHRNAKS